MHFRRLFRLEALMLSMFVGASLLPLPCSAVTYSANKVTLTDLSGSPQPNRPFSISRVFAQGEILNYAQPRAVGVPLTTWQCDRMNSWPDGSLKHAIISFKYTLPNSSAPLVIDFVNNTNPSSAGDVAATQAAALSQAAMLAFDPGTGAGTWGAQIDATQGITQTANARAMLTAGAWRYWLRGPVVTQVIVEDRTSSRTYDFGWQCTANCNSNDYTQTKWVQSTGQYQSLHPTFVLTFYPGWNGVQTDYILEDSWADRLQDQYYNLTLRAKSDNSVTPYIRSNLWHNAATRWRRRYWQGTTPGRIKQDLNFSYLASSKAILNWDQTKKVGAAATGLEVADFKSHMNDPSTFYTDQAENVLDVRSTGQYTGDLGAPGGRPELGPLPRTDVRWLYTMDEGLYRAMIGNANTLGEVPVHVRENRMDNYLVSSAIEPTRTTKAFGYFLTVDGRPSGNYYSLWQGSGGDNITLLSPYNRMFGGHGGDAFAGLTPNGGTPDNSTVPYLVAVDHYAPTTYTAYLATGDWYFLEELEAAAQYGFYLQPQNGANALMDAWNVDLRGITWEMRNAAFVAFIAPSSDKIGAYAKEKVQNNLAAYEGRYNITTGALHTNTNWNYGLSQFATANQTASRLQGGPAGSTTTDPWYTAYFHVYGFVGGATDVPGSSSGYFNANTVNYVEAPWQHGYWIMSLGWMRNFGITDADLFLSYQSKYIIDRMQAPGTANYHYNPYLTPWYYAAALDTKDNYLSGQQLWDTFAPEYHDIKSWTADTKVYNTIYPDSLEHGYNWIIYTAAAITQPYSDGTLTGQGSWSWIASANSPWAQYLGNNSTGCSNLNASNCDNPKWALVPAVAANAANCDVNRDGLVSVVDLQVAVNQSSRMMACTTGDVNGDGSCDANDVKAVQNAILVGSCK